MTSLRLYISCRKGAYRMIEKDFRTTLKNERKKRGLTQIDMAELVGCYEHAISEYENGTHVPSLWRTEDILNALGLMLVIVPFNKEQNNDK